MVKMNEQMEILSKEKLLKMEIPEFKITITEIKNLLNKLNNELEQEEEMISDIEHKKYWEKKE